MKENSEIPSFLVPLFLAKQLKRIGFDEKTVFFYSFDNCAKGLRSQSETYNMNCSQFFEGAYVSLPMWEQVLEWFRKKGFLTSIIHSSLMFPINTKGDCKGETSYYYKITKNINGVKASTQKEAVEIERESLLFSEDCFKSYEACRKRMIRILIKLYENKI